jgi:hypothetical protein
LRYGPSTGTIPTMGMNTLRARVAGTCTLITLAAAVAPGAAHAAGWTPPTQFDGSRAEAAIDARGDLGLVWQAADDRVGVAFRPAGGTFAATTLSFGEHVYTPRIAMNAAGDVAVGVAGPSAMHVQVLHADGTLGRPTDITPGYGTYGGLEFAHIGMDDAGEVLAAWNTYSGGSSYLSYALVGADGTAGPRSASAYTTGAQFDVAMNGAGDGLVAWTKVAGGRAYATVATRRPSGGFDPPVDVSGDPAHDAVDAKAAINDRGDAVISYDQSDGFNTRLRVVSRPHGGLFTTPADVSPAGINANYGAAAIASGGDVVVSWNTNGATNMRAGTLAAPFTAPITSVTPSGTRPVTVIAPDGSATVLFAGFGTDGSPQLLATMRGPGGAFGEPATVARNVSGLSGNIAYGPSGSDAAGDVVASWTTDGTQVGLSVYDRAPPELRGLSVPGSGTAGGAVAFSVAPWDAFSAVGTPHWDFGDGASADGASASHAYAAAGSYRVTVSATDAAGNTASQSATVAVGAAPAAGGPAPAPAPRPSPPAARRAAATRCRVPSLTNLTATRAKAKLRTAHCALGRVTTPRKYRKRRGLVVRAQSRRAGTTAAAGTKVNVTLGVRPKPRKHARKHRK